jgi:hypothetical protein
VKSNVRTRKDVKSVKFILVKLEETVFYINTDHVRIVAVLCSEDSGKYIKYEVPGTTKEGEYHKKMTAEEFMAYTIKNGLGIAVIK